MTYPIRVPFEDYNGTDDSKRRKAGDFNQLGERVAAYVNGEFKKAGLAVKEFGYAEIGRTLGVDPEAVADSLMSIGGGHNAITVHRSEPT